MPQVIIADAVLALDSEAHFYQPGYLVLEGGQIIEVGSAEGMPPAMSAGAVYLKDRLVMPGLVNAHTHAALNDGERNLKISNVPTVVFPTFHDSS